MYYSILVRWGPEWDGQSVIYTESKALFDALDTANDDIYYNSGFSEELKQEILDKHNAIKWSGEPKDIEEDMGLCDAIEYLQVHSVKYPITILDHTDFTPYWNY